MDHEDNNNQNNVPQEECLVSADPCPLPPTDPSSIPPTDPSFLPPTDPCPLYPTDPTLPPTAGLGPAGSPVFGPQLSDAVPVSFSPSNNDQPVPEPLVQSLAGPPPAGQHPVALASQGNADNQLTHNVLVAVDQPHVDNMEQHGLAAGPRPKESVAGNSILFWVFVGSFIVALVIAGYKLYKHLKKNKVESAPSDELPSDSNDNNEDDDNNMGEAVELVPLTRPALHRNRNA